MTIMLRAVMKDGNMACAGSGGRGGQVPAARAHDELLEPGGAVRHAMWLMQKSPGRADGRRGRHRPHHPAFQPCDEWVGWHSWVD